MRIGLQTWGSEGDIRPFIALAAGLTTAGHEVTLLVSDNSGRDYGGLAERFVFQLRNIRNPENPSAEKVERVWREIIEVGNPVRQAELVMKHGFDPLTESMYQAATEFCRANDAVVGHFFVFPLHVAAEKAGVPLAKSVERLLKSPDMADKAAKLGAAMSGEDGVKKAVDLIDA